MLRERLADLQASTIHRRAMANWIVRYSCSLGRDSSTCVKWFVGVFAEEMNRSGQLIPDAVLLECGTFHLSMACQRIGTTCWDCMVALARDRGNGLDFALLSLY